MGVPQAKSKLLADVRARLSAVAATPQAVLDPAAADLVNALLTVTPGTPEDLEVLQAAGWFFWTRHDLGAPAGAGDQKLALIFLQRCYNADPASVPAEARPALSAAGPSDYMLNGHVGILFLRRHAPAAGELDEPVNRSFSIAVLKALHQLPEGLGVTREPSPGR